MFDVVLWLFLVKYWMFVILNWEDCVYELVYGFFVLDFEYVYCGRNWDFLYRDWVVYFWFVGWDCKSVWILLIYVIILLFWFYWC